MNCFKHSRNSKKDIERLVVFVRLDLFNQDLLYGS